MISGNKHHKVLIKAIVSSLYDENCSFNQQRICFNAVAGYCILGPKIQSTAHGPLHYSKAGMRTRFWLPVYYEIAKEYVALTVRTFFLKDRMNFKYFFSD